MSRYRNFHAGEAQLQAESGIDTDDFDASVDQPFRPELNPSEAAFIGKRTFSVAATIDGSARPWASPLFGQAGELFVVEGPTTVRVQPRLIDGDPLFENIRTAAEMGVLYIDPSRRRRAKSLGQAVVEKDGSIVYRMHRMFGLCTKYIVKRSHETVDESGGAPTPPSTVTPRLTGQDRTQLAEADTIFLASRSEKHGTDPTHRGGPPGFVNVIDGTTLSIPDYPGNGMFQTLGNLVLDDCIGLLSIDFETGRTLQLTGRGSIRRSPPDDVASERTLTIEIDEVRAAIANAGSWAPPPVRD